MTTIPDKEFFKPHELAILLGEPLEKVYRWIRERRIIALRFGREFKIEREEVLYIVSRGTREIEHNQ